MRKSYRVRKVLDDSNGSDDLRCQVQAPVGRCEESLLVDVEESTGGGLEGGDEHEDGELDASNAVSTVRQRVERAAYSSDGRQAKDFEEQDDRNDDREGQLRPDKVEVWMSHDKLSCLS